MDRSRGVNARKPGTAAHSPEVQTGARHLADRRLRHFRRVGGFGLATCPTLRHEPTLHRLFWALRRHRPGIAGLRRRSRIAPLGLTQTVLWRTTQFAWTDVYNFAQRCWGWRATAVGSGLLDREPTAAALRGLNIALAGVQGTLQPGWEVAPQDLAKLLNDAREHWLAAPRDAPCTPFRLSVSQPSLLTGVAEARQSQRLLARDR